MLKNKFDLQLFTAPANMTGKTQLDGVKAREIDFVTSFGSDLSQLLNILGISRMIEKPNGTVLKTKKVTGVLQAGTVAEGEEIPYSQFTVTETPLDPIVLEKYRKGVSIEAIADKGYEVAVADTDEELKAQLRNKVTDKFYEQLNKGSLTGKKATFQAAIANSIGLVKDKFEKMQKSVTGIATFVNTLDFYDYLGDKTITLETAFGLTYVKNFLGADVVFLTSKVKAGTVISTPLNNLVGYYVNPANSEFAKAGFNFTTDSETGFIGYHADTTYNRMISDIYALMGVRVFAEYLDGIAKVTVTPAGVGA